MVAALHCSVRNYVRLLCLDFSFLLTVIISISRNKKFEFAWNLRLLSLAILWNPFFSLIITSSFPTPNPPSFPRLCSRTEVPTRAPSRCTTVSVSYWFPLIRWQWAIITDICFQNNLAIFLGHVQNIRNNEWTLNLSEPGYLNEMKIIFFSFRFILLQPSSHAPIAIATRPDLRADWGILFYYYYYYNNVKITITDRSVLLRTRSRADRQGD